MKHYKYVHIIHNDKFIVPFMEFVAKHFDANEHLYIYAFDDNVVKYPIPEADNVLNINNRYLGKKNFLKLSAALTPRLEHARKIILHGLFSEDLVNYLFWHRRLLSKCSWVMWGGDLYGSITAPRRWRNAFQHFRRCKVIERMGGLITYIPGDYALAQEHFNAKGVYEECIMYGSNVYEEYDVPESVRDALTIQVGNSADPSNNHFEIFEKLLPLVTESTQIIAPLSYANQAHADAVQRRGNALFGNRFTALRDYMPFDAYLQLLSKVDIAVFYHRRQQAMGNIITLLGLGKKVYVRSDITSWDFFTKLGVKVFDFDRFDTSPISEEDRMKNIANIKEYFSEERLVEQLKNIFRTSFIVSPK